MGLRITNWSEAELSSGPCATMAIALEKLDELCLNQIRSLYSDMGKAHKLIEELERKSAPGDRQGAKSESL